MDEAASGTGPEPVDPARDRGARPPRPWRATACAGSGPDRSLAGARPAPAGDAGAVATRSRALAVRRPSPAASTLVLLGECVAGAGLAGVLVAALLVALVRLAS